MADQSTESDSQEVPKRFAFEPGRRRLFRIIGFGLLGLSILMAIYGTVVYIAYERGQALSVENARQALEEEMDRQMANARQDVEDGNYSLALRRLDWIMARQPEFPGLDTLQQEAQDGMESRLAPTPVPAPSRTPLTEEIPDELNDPSEAFSKLQKIAEEADWQMAVEEITAFQVQYPEFRRREIDILLYNAFVNLGSNLLAGDQVELGLFYLAQAETLGDLPADIEDQRTWAELYLAGIGFYGVDWATTVFYFRDLCAAAPFYQDACDTLREALVAYGDQYAFNLDWCPAGALYSEAVSLSNQTLLAAKLREAKSNCLLATPTPTTAITTTLTITATSPSN
jgi:hypothetical protein